jgi:hypothetical protein
MLRRTLVAVALTLVAGVPLLSQEPPKQPQAPQQRAQPQEKEKERERDAGGQPINIRIELTIRDQRGEGQPQVKTVNLVAADRSVGRIRSSGSQLLEKMGFRDVTLNVDARPMILRESQMRVNLTIEYRPAAAEAGPAPSNTLSETIECIVQSGQPLVVSKSADPNSDRSVTVEVKATVLKN